MSLLRSVFFFINIKVRMIARPQSKIFFSFYSLKTIRKHNPFLPFKKKREKGLSQKNKSRELNPMLTRCVACHFIYVWPKVCWPRNCFDSPCVGVASPRSPSPSCWLVVRGGGYCSAILGFSWMLYSIFACLIYIYIVWLKGYITRMQRVRNANGK